MGDEPYTTPRETSAKGSRHSTSPHLAAYAGQRAQVLFGSYRRGDANDPDAYVAAITAVLSLYDADLIREVTDPRTGICTAEKFASFMPNAGELKIYCEAIAARKERVQRLGKLARPDPALRLLEVPEPRPGDKATVFVPSTHERYSKLVAWSQDPQTESRKWRYGQSGDNRDGIWIAWDVWDDRPAPMRSIGGLAAAVTLSAAARKTMADVDAERFGELPAGQAAE